jgi:hypothetical protein
MGAVVTERIYPGLGHTVNEEELGFARGLLGDIIPIQSIPAATVMENL